MKKHFIHTLFYVLGIAMTAAPAQAQKAYLEKPDEFDPAKPCKIMVNLKLTSNDWGIIEAAEQEDMYLWIWKPIEHPAGHPLANGIGSAAWKNSNDALKMTKEAPGLYSYTLIPTDFFGVDANKVYKEDFHFLVKPKDGGGFGDPDRKTEDLTIPVDPPAGPVVKIKTMPVGKGDKKDTMIVSTRDVFSVIYNNTVEEKVSMQNATDLYVFPVAYDDMGGVYRIAANAKRAGDFPQLKMRQTAPGIFQFSIMPEKLFTIPTGRKIIRIEYQIVKPGLVNSDDAIDDKMIYHFNSGGC
jgi:hypothetical protein